MERVFRSFKSEWMPSEGYRSFAEAKKDIGHYLMDYYNSVLSTKQRLWLHDAAINGSS